MIKVLFNDKCSICSKEINHYKNLNVKDINWLDINDLTVATRLSGKSHKELLRRLHVIRDDRIYSGVRAFVIMWDSIPRYRWKFQWRKKWEKNWERVKYCSKKCSSAKLFLTPFF